MVSAVVQQRDMYRTLLAQSTPLPGDNTMTTDGGGRTPPSRSVTKHFPTTTTPTMATVVDSNRSVSMATSPREEVVAVETETAAGALKELREQFETYRREKGKNEAMMNQQTETLRQEASALRMDNVKIAAKVCKEK